MPATAGRVRMPANNRVHSSAALQTHGIWQSAIGYDPYAPDQKQQPAGATAGGTAAGDRDAVAAHAASSADQQNAYDSFQGLLALARLTGSNADEARGSCRKCGRVGHLPFQCRNFLVLKDEAALAAAAASTFPGFADRDGGSAAHRKEKSRERRRRDAPGRDNDGGAGSDLSSEDQSSDDEDSDLSDSSEDSEMERAITAKYGKNLLKSSSHNSKLGHKKERSETTRRKSRSKQSKSRKDASEDDDGSSEEDKKKAKHGLKPKRSRKEAAKLGSDEDSRGSDGAERRRKKRTHSRKHSDSRNKDRGEQSDESSEGEDAKHAKKRRHRGRHKGRKHG